MTDQQNASDGAKSNSSLPIQAKTRRKLKLVIGQLGSPKSPKTADVRVYLKEFLGDPRVVDINPLLWKIILNLFVLPFRPKKSGEAYGRIWNGSSFPLIDNTLDFCHEVEKHVPDFYEVEPAFLLSPPRVNDILDRWEAEPDTDRAEEVWVIPQFPQYSESTIASVFDTLGKSFSNRVNIPDLHLITSFHKSKCFIDGSVRQIVHHLAALKEAAVKNESAAPDQLVISFHGIPLRRVLEKKDIYYRHCFETYYLIKGFVQNHSAELAQEWPDEKWHFCFQSRFGSEQWLGPATDEYAEGLAKKGAKHLAVYCPSFVADCLETTDEIGNELGEELEEYGTHVSLIPCLNSDPQWAKEFAEYARHQIEGTFEQKRESEYAVDAKEIAEMIPEQKYESEPLTKETKSTLKIVFVTVFLDLIGFSLIFPMFPAMADYYLQVDGDNFFLQSIFGMMKWTVGLAGDTAGLSLNPVVLFGGILGALYSLLQFIAAPIWGSLSDRYGRKPIMMTTVAGLFISYVMWVFSGSFTLLVLARFIGGIMGGNISTASAIVADVTSSNNRSKGMATIGIAFAMGFIIGPAIGGILTLVDLREFWSVGESFGLNPFSAPALLAAVLTIANLRFIIKKLPETLPAKKRGQVSTDRTSNVLKLFKPLPYKGVNLSNFGYFFFILAFSGMEFTLTFLAAERLSYRPVDNGVMFIFIGFIIALVQGGYVRRKASQVGEKKMALQGLIAVLPGLIILAYAQSTFGLYGGLFFLAVGSAMIIPCLTSLASLYAPSEEQGRVLGVFRSLGSLARVIGPFAASIIYWRYGSAYPYLIGSAFLIVPLLLIAKLPKREVAAS